MLVSAQKEPILFISLGKIWSDGTWHMEQLEHVTKFLWNISMKIWKIQQKTIENVCQLRLSENFAKNFTGNCNCRQVFEFFSKFLLNGNEETCFIVFCYVSQIFRKMFCKLIELFFMNDLMYNIVTWFDLSMALKYLLYQTAHFSQLS